MVYRAPQEYFCTVIFEENKELCYAAMKLLLGSFTVSTLFMFELQPVTKMCALAVLIYGIKDFLITSMRCLKNIQEA